jgi:hypothetical protein
MLRMPTLLGARKAASGSDRYSKVVLESPESLARDMLSKGLPRNPKRARHLLPHREEHLLYGEYVNPRVDQRGHERMLEQSYNSIVPMKVGNRRASARSGHGSHWREGRHKEPYLLKET